LCASGSPSQFSYNVPVLPVSVNGVVAKGLIDTGSAMSIITPVLCKNSACFDNIKITMMNGVVDMRGEYVVCLVDIKGRSFEWKFVVVPELLAGFDVIIGWDMINFLGGLSISKEQMTFGFESKKSKVLCNVSSLSPYVDDDDFIANFDNGKWIVGWKWANSERPHFSNGIGEYKVPSDLREQYESEVNDWIEAGWLKPFHGKELQTLPLMAVAQPAKNKVRPVLDYRKLNAFISTHSGDSLVCAESLRKWRQMGKNTKLVDLRKAYLQIHVEECLWPYQVVKYKGKSYCLTRLGFGLNIAPKVMCRIIAYVLSLRPDWKDAVEFYIDDLFINENVVKVEEVINHLSEWGLQCKPPENLIGARVLGLRTYEKRGNVWWKRDGEVPKMENKASKRQLFSWCGKVVGHYPVANWARIVLSWIKRQTNQLKWDCYIGDTLSKICEEVLCRLCETDPVCGIWNVDAGSDAVLWCDASSIALGVVLQLNGVVVEDCSWLRKEDDQYHINNAELEAVLKGLSLATKWNVSKLWINVDSAAVYGWINSLITKDRKIRVTGLSEPLLRRRICLIQDIIDECGMTVKINLVPSEKNLADVLTRVPTKWQSRIKQETITNTGLVDDKKQIIRKIHQTHHSGANKTTYHLKHIYPNINWSLKEVRSVVNECNVCRSIDPHPESWEKGSLSVEKNWYRLAIDETHYKSSSYLSIIDCGPSRFCVWRNLSVVSAANVCVHLENLFLDFGPPCEVLADNGSIFHSNAFKDFLQKWSVRLVFRCAYRPSGNGIVERSHRTIKCIAARSNCSIRQAVFWYNILPKTSNETSPSSDLFHQPWRFPNAPNYAAVNKPNNYSVGQHVFFKPSQHARCDQEWPIGIVTCEGDRTHAEINGTKRHVADIRPVSENVDYHCAHLRNDDGNAYVPIYSGNQSDDDALGFCNESRQRRRPIYLNDYVCD